MYISQNKRIILHDDEGHSFVQKTEVMYLCLCLNPDEKAD